MKRVTSGRDCPDHSHSIVWIVFLWIEYLLHSILNSTFTRAHRTPQLIMAAVLGFNHDISFLLPFDRSLFVLGAYNCPLAFNFFPSHSSTDHSRIYWFFVQLATRCIISVFFFFFLLSFPEIRFPLDVHALIWYTGWIREKQSRASHANVIWHT